MDNGRSSYLIEGRIGDVLALIQVLAFDKHTRRSEEGLVKEFQNKPSSANSWIELAKHHSEFFRVRSDEDESKVVRVSLVSRYVREKVGDRRPLLNDDFVTKLMNVAVDLHDRALERKNENFEKRKLGITLMIATGSIAATIISAIIKVWLVPG